MTTPLPLTGSGTASSSGDLDLDRLRAQDPSGLLEGIDRAVVWEVRLTTRFRGLTRRDGVLLHGPAGWGELSPFWDYGPDDSAPWLAAALEQACGGLTGLPVVRQEVPVNVTVPEIDPELAHTLVSQAEATTAKVKVTGSQSTMHTDLERLAAVREGLGPSGRIRIDVNGAWDLDTAVGALPHMARVAEGLEYAEQPCARLEDLAALRRLVSVPIAADESIRLSDDPLAVARSEAADVAVLKVAPLGGVRRALALAERLGLPAVVSSALDTSVGIAAGVALAAALPRLDYACGLGTVRLLERDVAVPSFVPTAGYLPVRSVHVSRTLLRTATCQDDDVISRWQVRLGHILGALRARREREERYPSAAVAGLPL